jgi:hypothetical protein
LRKRVFGGVRGRLWILRQEPLRLGVVAETQVEDLVDADNLLLPAMAVEHPDNFVWRQHVGERIEELAVAQGYFFVRVLMLPILLGGPIGVGNRAMKLLSYAGASFQR